MTFNKFIWLFITGKYNKMEQYLEDSNHEAGISFILL